MHLVYFDEVKYEYPRNEFYYIGALIVNDTQLKNLEEKLENISTKFFGNPFLDISTEFHASSIIAAKKQYENWDYEKRVAALKALIDILASENGIGKISIRIEPSKIKYRPESYEDWAFKFLIEKVESYLASIDMVGILIGDKDDEVISKKFRDNLSLYRKLGTPHAFGIDLNHLVDTIYFSQSHHSRLLQLCDFFIWLRQASEKVWAKKKVSKLILEVVSYAQQKHPNSLYLNKYKDWPTSQSIWLNR